MIPSHSFIKIIGGSCVGGTCEWSADCCFRDSCARFSSDTGVWTDGHSATAAVGNSDRSKSAAVGSSYRSKLAADVTSDRFPIVAVASVGRFPTAAAGRVGRFPIAYNQTARWLPWPPPKPGQKPLLLSNSLFSSSVFSKI